MPTYYKIARVYNPAPILNPAGAVVDTPKKWSFKSTIGTKGDEYKTLEEARMAMLVNVPIELAGKYSGWLKSIKFEDENEDGVGERKIRWFIELTDGTRLEYYIIKIKGKVYVNQVYGWPDLVCPI